jgi:hypothetical protein
MIAGKARVSTASRDSKRNTGKSSSASANNRSYFRMRRTIETPGGFAIICGGHSRPKFCACGREATSLCDWKVSSHKSGTCDEPICAAHSERVAPNKDLCPAHQQAYAQWKLKHPPAQQSLFEEAT